MRQFFLIVLTLCGITGCGSPDPHSSLDVPSCALTVWTYAKVSELRNSQGKATPIAKHYYGKLTVGETAVLEGGHRIQVETKGTLLDGKALPVGMRNVVVNKNGTYEPNAFIRDFD